MQFFDNRKLQKYNKIRFVTLKTKTNAEWKFDFEI